MVFAHGKNARLWWGTADLSSYFNEITTSAKVDTGETTTFGAVAKGYVAGSREGTISLKGLWDGAVGAVDEYLSSLIGNDAGQVVTASPTGLTAGATTGMASTLQSEYQTSAPVSDVVSITSSLQADGGIDTGKLLCGNVAASTATNGTGVDNTTATTNGGVAHLHVPTNTRDGSCVVKVQHSVDNTTYVDLVTFTTVTATTAAVERVVVATGTTVNRYLRSQITPAGSTGAVTTTVAFARR